MLILQQYRGRGELMPLCELATQPTWCSEIHRVSRGGKQPHWLIVDLAHCTYLSRAMHLYAEVSSRRHVHLGLAAEAGQGGGKAL
jgi:hypothetical protein